ncbi:MAG: exodeoxyribonuclease VII small subunit [Ignavibacteriales bacterium CG_4_9_14_3_um_filter_30_11]|nr:MAG: exodeoxyribonuclease VII small subunit [Ignavibacteriales bacterium CG_4_9_14_3_um_filter_30_11]
MKKKKSENNFEVKLKRLEEISNILENEEVSMDESLALFEEGVSLSKECMLSLNGAELKITKLKEKFDAIIEKEKNNLDEYSDNEEG